MSSSDVLFLNLESLKKITDLSFKEYNSSNVPFLEDEIKYKITLENNLEFFLAESKTILIIIYPKFY